ncbi:ATP-binding protein [Streptomyces luteocolor]|uniref:ATP-binding protein n=1 Tax=Streptomyces luteocolor TaxID=285500 RepID=UPI000852F6D4|nr:NB-ARC domain-containing protein [Streptomyces luteocolor]
MLGNVPEYTGLFVGRAAERDRLLSALTAHRLTTLTGVGGVGKTRLAAHTLASLPGGEAESPGEVRWVDLGALPDERRLIPAVAEAVGFSDHTSGEPLEALCGWMSDRRMLLVLDSCEHLVAACRELVGLLLAACPGLTVLVTSRQQLDMPAETVVEVAPLPHDGAAFDLFIDRATVVAPALRVRRAEQDEDAAEVCRLLDGVPLALELAAAQLMHHTLGELRALLRTQQEALTAATPVWPLRHRSLRAAIGWSHELCEPLERLLWARLSIFRDTFDEAAARSVCSGGPLSADAVVIALKGLTAKSVVVRQPDGGLRLLGSVREYGWMWLGELGQREAVQNRHAEHFLALARSADAGWLGPDQVTWYRTIGAVHADLCAALDHLIRVRPHLAVELAGLVGFFWSCCGHLREARAYLTRTLRLSRTHTRERERAQWALGVATLLQGEHRLAADIGRRCAKDAARSDNREGRLAAAYLLSITHLMCGRAREAYTVLDEALRETPTPPFDSPAALRCHLAEVFALTGLGRFAEAARKAATLRVGCIARDECWTRAYADYQLALIALAQGDPAQATEHARAMLEGKRRLGDSFGMALGMDLLAAAAAAQGRGEVAALISGAGESCWRSVGHSQRGMPELRDVRETCWTTARTTLGDEAFDQAFRRGTEADPGSVVALVVEGRLADG